MDTILQIIQHHPNPKVRGVCTFICLVLGFFGWTLHFMGPDWIIKGLQAVSLGMVIFINYPAFKKRAAETWNKLKLKLRIK